MGQQTDRNLWAAAAAAILLTVAVPGQASAEESTINLKAHSVVVTEAHALPNTTKSLSNVSLGHAVTIRCKVHVEGVARVIDPGTLGSGYGASSWRLASKQGKGFYALAFKQALKVALLVDGQTVTVATIDQLALNAAFPQTDRYPFNNSGMLHVVSADWLFPKAGQHTLQCLVDAGHTVKETQEADNQVTGKVSVTGPATQHGPTTSVAQGTLPPQQPATTQGDRGRAAARSPAAPASERETDTARKKKPSPEGRAFDPDQAYTSVPTRRGRAAVQAFQAPVWKGRRVDWCLHAGTQCGVPAATEFCKRMGYPKASASTIAKNVGQQGSTLLLGDDKLCAAAVCHGFASITCSQ